MSSHGLEAEATSILIVDDNLNNLNLLSDLLSQQGYGVRKALNGQLALISAKTKAPDLILLDVMMPQMNGYEVCQQLKECPSTRDIPVIFLSALGEVLDKIKAFEVGGVDYITKPFNAKEVLARVKTHVTLQLAKAQISQLNQELERRVQERTAQLAAANRELQYEITERRQMQAQLIHTAMHDALTGLPNRSLFTDRLEQTIYRARQRQSYQFAVLFLDCDRFKLVNDSFGHLIGDQLLIAVAQRLQQVLRPVDMIARFGGDEFTILLEELDHHSNAIAVANRLHQALNQPFQIGPHEIFINASIGIVVSARDYDRPETILRDADIAMYRAKASGKARSEIFNPGMHHHIRTVLQLETDLRIALEQQDFQIHYQPIICLQTQAIVGFEALLRWHHQEQGFISPTTFIPIAEETELIIPIGIWALQEACRQFQQWQNRGLISPNSTMSVNLSVKQFSQPDLIQQIDQILQGAGMSGQSLNLEITESVIMENAAAASALLRQLADRQVQLSIDDFGTGYSSLSCLHEFPVNHLKIDRSFIQRIGEKGENLEIVQAIVSLAHHLKISVTAEGIETTSQFEQLRHLGCQSGQGYLFCKPLPPDAIAERLINTHQQWLYDTSQTMTA